MSPEPAKVDPRSSLLIEVHPLLCGRQTGSARAMAKHPHSLKLFDRIRTLAAELRHHDPKWADRLSGVSSEQELLDIVAALLNLSHALRVSRAETVGDAALSTRISAFVRTNLHKGLTLKLLARFLGYSEKYCSDLFQATMGEPFSEHLKRRRLEKSRTLLTTTDRSMADIASETGFSDQFAFSHFFKRATGYSPMEFRSRHRPRPRKASTLLAKGLS